MVYNPRDTYFHRAKHDGYRSRAAYKLLELQQRLRLMQPGDGVVDLGAAPGGWLQVAAKIVGSRGKVIGVDLQPIQTFAERHIVGLQGDITSGDIQRRIKELIGGTADCVLSDLSPKLSGIRDADMARCLDLNRTALAVALQLLRRGGGLLIKSFTSNDSPTFSAELKAHFASIQRTKPEATRQGSSEFYFYAKGFIPGSTDAD